MYCASQIVLADSLLFRTEYPQCRNYLTIHPTTLSSITTRLIACVSVDDGAPRSQIKQIDLLPNDSTVAELDHTNLTEREKRTPLSQRKSVYQTTIGEDEPLADAISTAVAAVSRDQEEFPPLSDCIDVDRLETQVDSFRDSDSGAVQFLYTNYRIEIQWTGELTLWPQSTQ